MNILLTGGSACGKSTYAEKLISTLENEHRYYIATMRPYDDECIKKIERHRKQRESGRFITIEQPVSIGSLILPHRGTALLECMCNLCANEMFDESGNMRDPFDDIINGIEKLKAQCRHLIVVTNDVGGEYSAEYDSTTNAYIQTLGALNAHLASDFDCVYELVCSIPLVLKGELLI
ncbi:MAG: bifunctional adenosylcobinamide kinase/adenosylcobinamide-phosphate guanylyltransferase [Clostridia bacterium]|nr:bifunctional adenosylcobinamide kinase/adenosylcobinamide-phosphate guanylyltransferase [Clostridia bacterium]